MATAKKRGNGLVFTFEHDGSIKLAAAGIGEHRFHPREASLECNSQATLKGWKSTFEDAAAKSRDAVTGASAPLAERFAASVAIMKHYADKNVTVWGRKATGGTREGTDAGLVLQALMNVKGWTLDECNVKVSKMAEGKGLERKDILASLAKNPDIIREVADIKAKRAAASSVDAASLLDELDGLEDEDEEDAGEDVGDEAPEAPF